MPVFGRTLFAVEGYSLEVFRGEIHLGSVRTRGAESTSNSWRASVQMKVYNGDVIYWVSLVHQSIPVVGSLSTKDKYIRIYDFTIDLVVSDPVLFIRGYRLGKDPVNVAIESFKYGLQRYAAGIEHDKLSNFRPSDAWNNSLRERTGMKLIKISQWNFRDDPKRAEVSALQQEAEKIKLSFTIKAEIQKLEDSHERERDRQQREHEREEETQQHMHRLHMMLRDTAAEELTAILRERIRYTFETGKQIDEVAEDSLKLLNAFHEALQRGRVVDTTLSSGSSTSTNGASSEAGAISGDEETAIERDPNTDPVIYTQSDVTDLS